MHTSDHNSIDRSLHHKVTDFARKHESHLVEEINAYVRRYFLKSRGCFFVALLIVSTGFLIAWKLGLPALVFIHVPAFLCLACYSWLSRYSERINKHAVAYFNVFMGLVVLETTVLYHFYHQAGKIHLIDNSAPFGLSMVIWALNFSYRRLTYLTIASSFQVLLVLSVAIPSPAYFQVNAVGFALGAILGAILNILLQNVFRYKFYFSQMEKRQTTHAYRQLEKVVYPHQRRSIENGEILERTMPVGWGEACVIVFNILECDHIPPSLKREFRKRVLYRCQAEMMYGYDGLGMTASGYRIKELGDGFLCSVGYPFHLPPRTNPAAVALQLTRSFLAIVEQEAQRLDPQLMLPCSVGIAYGALEAVYPTTYPKEYELYGTPLLEASRLESFRQTYLSSYTEGHLIILQEAVYQALEPTKQRLFSMQTMPEQAILDGDDVRQFHFQFLPLPIARIRSATQLVA